MNLHYGLGYHPWDRIERYPTYNRTPMLSGAQKEKQKRKEGQTCPCPKPHRRFPVTK